MHPLPVLVSMRGGLVVFGSAGFVLGPVVVTIAQYLLMVRRQRTRGGRPAEAALSP